LRHVHKTCTKWENLVQKCPSPLTPALLKNGPGGGVLQTRKSYCRNQNEPPLKSKWECFEKKFNFFLFGICQNTPPSKPENMQQNNIPFPFLFFSFEGIFKQKKIVNTPPQTREYATK
jgi:hypothetical protein